MPGAVFDSKNALLEHDFDNEGEVIPSAAFRDFVEIEEDGHERSLAVGGLQRDQLILDGLAARFDFLADFLLDQVIELIAGSFDASGFKFCF